MSEVGLVETKSGFETDRLSGCFEAAPITSSCTSACTASGDLVQSGLGFCPICPKTLHNTSWSFVADRACQLDVRAQWEVWREVSPQREVPAD